MIIIGIVGSPAGGKSTVAKILGELGATWINADEIAKSVLEEPQIRIKLLEYFGSDFEDPYGKIDREKLAGAVFGDDEEKRQALKYLESLVHPETRRRITQAITDAHRSGRQFTALEVPLMFESHWDLVCDEIWCIDAPAEMRQEWAKNRNWTAADLRKRESNQLPLDAKKRLSNVCITNNGDMKQLSTIVVNRWSSLSRKVSSKSSKHCFEQSNAT